MLAASYACLLALREVRAEDQSNAQNTTISGWDQWQIGSRYDPEELGQAEGWLGPTDIALGVALYSGVYGPTKLATESAAYATYLQLYFLSSGELEGLVIELNDYSSPEGSPELESLLSEIREMLRKDFGSLQTKDNWPAADGSALGSRRVVLSFTDGSNAIMLLRDRKLAGLIVGSQRFLSNLLSEIVSRVDPPKEGGGSDSSIESWLEIQIGRSMDEHPGSFEKVEVPEDYRQFLSGLTLYIYAPAHPSDLGLAVFSGRMVVLADAAGIVQGSINKFNSQNTLPGETLHFEALAESLRLEIVNQYASSLVLADSFAWDRSISNPAAKELLVLSDDTQNSLSVALLHSDEIVVACGTREFFAALDLFERNGMSLDRFSDFVYSVLLA